MNKATLQPRLNPSYARRQGAVFILCLGLLVILMALLLVYCQEVRTEMMASANRLAAVQADAIELGAEMWVLAHVEDHIKNGTPLTQLPAENLGVGNGFFWVLRPNPDQSQDFSFGIGSESGKLNINSATQQQLMMLPGLNDSTLASDIVSFSRPQNSNDADESDSKTRQRQLSFETVEELLLIDGLTPRLLYGVDLNRNGVIEQSERDQSGGFADDLGIANLLTCYAVEPNIAPDGSRRVGINSLNTTKLAQVLTEQLSAEQSASVLSSIRPITNLAGFPTLADFYFASGLNAADFAKICGYISPFPSAPSFTGLVDVNTAPKQVLLCIPGMASEDADTLINARTANGGVGGVGWAFDALGPQKAQAIANYITAGGFQYSADIVAVSGDGRAFTRNRIVVDCTKLPARIIYKRNLTSLGWPLDPQILETLRKGKLSQ